MKKWIKILAVCLCLMILPCALVGCKYNWSFFRSSVNVYDPGSSWQAEDGLITFHTEENTTPAISVDESGDEHVLFTINVTRGVLKTKEGEIPVVLDFDQGYPCLYIMVDDGTYPRPASGDDFIETWVAKHYTESDDEIVFTLEVEETTYFEVGQRIKLVYKKK